MAKQAMDRLIEAVTEKQNPTIFGIDTRYEYLPNTRPLGEKWIEEGMEEIWAFNRTLIDALHEIVPAVKVQVAYYEMYGVPGMEVFYKTIRYAKEMGLFVVADAKRNDIGPTASAYASAFLGETQLGEHTMHAFPSDMVTVNPYLGDDGIVPFTEEAKAHGKGIFVLVKTSNPSSGLFQDLSVEGKPLYYRVAENVEKWGSELIGEYGYSSVGAVVGATYPTQGKQLRDDFPSVYFLVPGYGAQGATAQDLVGCFDVKGQGAIVNASRSLLCAYKKHPRENIVDATRTEAENMKQDLLKAIGGRIERK